MLLAGMLAAIVSAPLFDRVFTNHLAITSKILVPISALGWFVLIWAGTLCFPSLVFHGTAHLLPYDYLLPSPTK